ncbi:hypothetical protein PYCC9005_001204 [Savitreella phatthalungensis]
MTSVSRPETRASGKSTRKFLTEESFPVEEEFPQTGQSSASNPLPTAGSTNVDLSEVVRRLAEGQVTLQAILLAQSQQPTQAPADNITSSRAVSLNKVPVLQSANRTQPSAFVAEVRGLLALYPEPMVRQAVLGAFAKNDDQTITTWYRTQIQLLNSDEAIASRTTSEWIGAFKDKFSLDIFQQLNLLRSLEYRPNEDMRSFIARVSAACLECGKASDVEMISEVVARLPGDYRLALSYNTFSTLDALEKELISRQDVLQARPKGNTDYRPRNYTADSRKRGSQASVNPSIEAKKGFFPSPPTACPECGSWHWLKGKFATPCQHKKGASAAAYNGTIGNSYRPKTEPVYLNSVSSSQGHEAETNLLDLDVPQAAQTENVNFIDLTNEGDQHYYDLTNISTETVYLVDKVDSHPLVWAKAIGPLPDEHNYKRLGPYMVQVAFNPPETVSGSVTIPSTTYFALDSGSAMSLISRQLLERVAPRAETIEKTTPHQLRGVVHGASVGSTHGVILPIYLPMLNGKWVGIKAFFHILDELSVGLILGNDIAVANQIRTDPTSRTYTLGGAHNWTGHLQVTRSNKDSERNLDRQPITAPFKIDLGAGESVKITTVIPLSNRRLTPNRSATRLTAIEPGCVLLTTEKRCVFGPGDILGYAESLGVAVMPVPAF